nr:uncharacterized protein LOC109150389 [Ipomoea trifida]
MARATPPTVTDQVPKRQSRGSGSRRAAEEDEHTVIKGEMGGQAAWLTNNGLSEVVHSTWNTHDDFSTNISRMGEVLAGWNRTVFGGALMVPEVEGKLDCLR